MHIFRLLVATFLLYLGFMLMTSKLVNEIKSRKKSKVEASSVQDDSYYAYKQDPTVVPV